MQPEKNCLRRQQHRKKLFVLKNFHPSPSKKIMVRPLSVYMFINAFSRPLLKILNATHIALWWLFV